MSLIYSCFKKNCIKVLFKRTMAALHLPPPLQQQIPNIAALIHLSLVHLKTHQHLYLKIPVLLAHPHPGLHPLLSLAKTQ